MTVGDTVTYTCISVQGPATIEWQDIDNGNTVLEMASGVTELTLVLGPVSQSRSYRCRVTVGGTSSTTVTLEIECEPTNNPWPFCHRVFLALWRKIREWAGSQLFLCFDVHYLLM